MIALYLRSLLAGLFARSTLTLVVLRRSHVPTFEREIDKGIYLFQDHRQETWSISSVEKMEK